MLRYGDRSMQKNGVSSEPSLKVISPSFTLSQTSPGCYTSAVHAF